MSDAVGSGGVWGFLTAAQSGTFLSQEGCSRKDSSKREMVFCVHPPASLGQKKRRVDVKTNSCTEEQGEAAPEGNRGRGIGPASAQKTRRWR